MQETTWLRMGWFVPQLWQSPCVTSVTQCTWLVSWMELSARLIFAGKRLSPQHQQSLEGAGTLHFHQDGC